MAFQRGKHPYESLQIGAEYYRQKKIEAVKNQRYEEAANWRQKEREALGIEKNEAEDYR